MAIMRKQIVLHLLDDRDLFRTYAERYIRLRQCSVSPPATVRSADAKRAELCKASFKQRDYSLHNWDHTQQLSDDVHLKRVIDIYKHHKEILGCYLGLET